MENGKFDENSSELQDLPNYIWHFRLEAGQRVLSSQKLGAVPTSVTKEEQSSYATDVRLADLKATLKRKKYNRRTRLWHLKQSGGMRVVELVFT